MNPSYIPPEFIEARVFLQLPNMENIEMDDAYTLYLSEDDDYICTSILARFSNSTRDEHHHLWAAISAMSQELKDKHIPSTPVAYLGFTCSSLDGLSSQSEPPAHVIDALLTILSIVFQKVSAAILMNKSEFLSELLVRVLRSSSLTVGVAVSGLKCISHLLIIRGRVNWSDVSSLYGLLLSFITDSCPKLHECLGSALVAMGPETFLGLIPLNLEAENLSQLESQGRTFSSRSTDALVHALWSLLPSFCNYASDTAESFKDLEQALCSALKDEPEIRGIICLSLQILIQQNKKTVEEVNDLADSEVGSARHRALANYSPQVTADNLSVLKSPACKLLDVLSDVFLNTTKDDAGCFQSIIGEFVSISDEEAVSKCFKHKRTELLNVKAKDSTDSNSNRAQLFDLAVSFLPGLNAEEVDLLFGRIKLALQDDERLIQKKAYKVLSIILRDCDRFLSSKLDELLDLIEVLPSCHFSAKQHRLDCLYLLVVHLSKSDAEQRRHVILSFLAEIILALTEAHNKTRNRAYDILVQIGHAYGDEEKGGKREDLLEFFYMVAGGLAGETPHMISAAMKGLARLAYEFCDLVSTPSNLVPSIFLLLQRKNKEIIKATLGFLKVLVAKSQTEGLHLHLESMVESLLKLQDATKTHFKAKVKFLLEMLVRKCGLDAVKAVMPEEHMKLLTNIRKIKERKEWKLGSKSEEARSQVSRATTSRLSRWNHTKIFSDFDDEETEDSDTDYMDAKTVSGKRRKASLQLKSKASSLRRRTNKYLLDQLEEEPLDLLDRQRTRSVLLSSENLNQKMESDDEPEIDDDGRLIICDEAESYKKKPSKPHSDARSEAGGSYLPVDSKKTHKRRKTSESRWAATGKEYVSKKAGGDLKRKDKLEPYAYWPLDRKMMSRRPEHRATARKGISSVVKMTKKLEGKSVSTIFFTKGFKV
ncbi:PREDICTED: RRP12 [Prunus dulcis]|uniref:PREDICTED: RRP12 n=2 Tax=Prunus dulcis TaxID=3755 RepID=A0A5E4E537_PRUDU|nr:PREDICTED: RRP12 [Prunus dulcis]